MSSRTVLCHLEDWRGILVADCRSLQSRKGAKGCFGCDAHSRLCATCKKTRPLCPEIDLCRGCLRETLGKERFLERDFSRTAYDLEVCVGCKKRPVYYNAYGLCLHCSAKEFTDFREIPCEVPAQVPEHPGNGHVSTLEKTKPEPGFPQNGDLTKLISGLNDIEQIVVTLRRRDAYEMPKIGEILGLSDAAVSRIYSEALQKINDSPN